MNLTLFKNQIHKIQVVYRFFLCAICTGMLISSLLNNSGHIQTLLSLCFIFGYFTLSHLLNQQPAATEKSLFNNSNIKAFSLLDSMLTGVLLAYLTLEPVTSGLLLIGYSAALISYRWSERLLFLLMLFVGLSFSYQFLATNTPPNHLQKLLVLVISGGFFMIILYQQQKKNRNLDKKLNAADNLNRELSDRVFHLAKYFSPTLRSAVLTGNRSHQHAEEKHLTIFFSDLKGFTELAEQLTANQLGNFLSVYLSQMSDIAIRFGGTIDKIIGDSMMVFFGDPETIGEETDAVNCVAMAATMRSAMEDLTRQWRDQGIDNPPSLRIGINSGLCKVGHFGTAQHFNYTLLGRSVNLASRLESAAADNEILISLSTYNLVKDRIDCQLAGEISVKGFNQPIITYRVMQLKNR